MNLETALLEYFNTSMLSFMKTIKFSELVFDSRAKYMCQYGCKNYNHKYSCPPASLKILGKLNKYKYAILFATTTEIPGDYSRYKTKALNNQKEMEIQRISAQITNLFNLHGIKHLQLSGGSCKRCRICGLNEGKTCKKPLDKQTSMEAIGIDCQITMHNAGFDFEMPNKNSINRSGCILLNEDHIEKIHFQKTPSLQKYSRPSRSNINKMINLLKSEYSQLFDEIEIVEIGDLKIFKSYCTQCKIKKKNFSCPPYSDIIDLNLWNYAIKWRWRNNNMKNTSYNKALKTIHAAFFSIGFYFALSLRDCYCDECVVCTYSNHTNEICRFRKLLAPSYQSQGIKVVNSKNRRYGFELL